MLAALTGFLGFFGLIEARTPRFGVLLVVRRAYAATPAATRRLEFEGVAVGAGAQPDQGRPNNQRADYRASAKDSRSMVEHDPGSLMP